MKLLFPALEKMSDENIYIKNQMKVNWVFYQLCHLSLAIPALSLAVPALSLAVPALSLSIPAPSLAVPGLSLSIPALFLAVPGIYDILSLSLVCPSVYSLYIS